MSAFGNIVNPALAGFSGHDDRAYSVTAIDNGYLVEHKASGASSAYRTIEEAGTWISEKAVLVEAAREERREERESFVKSADAAMRGASFGFAPLPPPSAEEQEKRDAEMAVTVQRHVEIVAAAVSKALGVPLSKLREKLFGVESWQDGDEEL